MPEPLTRDLTVVIDSVQVTRAELAYHAHRLRAQAHEFGDAMERTRESLTRVADEYDRTSLTLGRLLQHLRQRARLAGVLVPTPAPHAVTSDPAAIDVHGRARAVVDESRSEE